MKCKALKRISLRDGQGNLITYEKDDEINIRKDEVTHLEEDKCVIRLEEKESYLTEDELSKMTKAQLVDYAEELGLMLNESQKRETLLADILNYIEENIDNE